MTSMTDQEFLAATPQEQIEYAARIRRADPDNMPRPSLWRGSICTARSASLTRTSARRSWPGSPGRPNRRTASAAS